MVLVVLMAAAVAAERQRWFALLRGAPVDELVWIWTSDPPQAVVPRAFLAVRDFELERVPSSARLSVLGDPEYIVSLNGRQVGSGAFRPGAPRDLYEVARLLHSGTNRVALELRSAIGSGGATLRLEDDEGRLLVSSDSGWAVLRDLRGETLKRRELAGAEHVTVLGSSPLGRWGSPVADGIRPRLDQAVDRRREPSAVRYRLPTGSGEWLLLPPHARRNLPRLGGHVELDFGRELEGYLRLAFDVADPQLALVRFGNRPIESSGWNPDAIAITIAGRFEWHDAAPRRFRFVEVVGLDALTWAQVLPISRSLFKTLATPAPTSLWATEPPPQRYPVVDEIWRKWMSLPRRPAPGAVPRRELGARAFELTRDGPERTPERARARRERRSPAGR